MRQSNTMSIANTDRAAIRQALAILEEEGGIIIEDIIPAYTNINLDKGLKLKQKHHEQQALSSASRKAIRRSVQLNSKHRQESISSSISEAVSADSVDSCSCSSLKSDRSREVGDKAKRKSHTKRSSSRRHSHATHKSKKEPEDNSSSSSVNVNVNVKKSIRFSKYDEINYIPHINDISQEEIDSSWMSEDDYNTIRSRSLRLVEMIEDTKRYPISADTMIVNKHLICVRGLSDMTSQCVYERDLLQRRLQTAVFRIQEQQKEDNIVDPQAIRQVSRKYSKKSTKSARFVGISDGVTISNRH